VSLDLWPARYRMSGDLKHKSCRDLKLKDAKTGLCRKFCRLKLFRICGVDRENLPLH
jgi:hypothetical protein